MRDGQKIRFARHLRRSMTEAETHLWFHLRNRSFMGHKFRRQHPLDRYIVDFACVEARLIVELDGGQHASLLDDNHRTQVLQGMGYRVLRFWNNDVFLHRDDVLAAILDALHAQGALTPTPLPQAGEAL
ncbi:endonuclease domain-containing protein [Luteimonas aquatica]|uniref:endonuclease domain-containing protein n=1 Tax=Luteimonas aquatica TaxID=450364 RepID=UPI001F56375F|nr:endonuclease domain-containing protein [Luteimonas aquatica]